MFIEELWLFLEIGDSVRRCPCFVVRALQFGVYAWALILGNSQMLPEVAAPTDCKSRDRA